MLAQWTPLYYTGVILQGPCQTPENVASMLQERAKGTKIKERSFSFFGDECEHVNHRVCSDQLLTPKVRRKIKNTSHSRTIACQTSCPGNSNWRLVFFYSDLLWSREEQNRNYCTEATTDLRKPHPHTLEPPFPALPKALTPLPSNSSLFWNFFTLSWYRLVQTRLSERHKSQALLCLIQRCIGNTRRNFYHHPHARVLLL